MHDEPTFENRPKPRSGKLYVAVVLFVVLGVLVIVIDRVQTELLSSVRAYLVGESLWSKAQKNGMQDLLQYARTRDPAHFRAYHRALAVPHGDRSARKALQRTPPDIEAARDGYLAGGNDPADIDRIIWLFLNFKDMPHMALAIRIWSDGDEELEHVQSLAEALHERITNDGPGADLAPIIDQLEQANHRLTVLEDQFTTTLSDAARWVAEVGVVVNTLITLSLFGGGALITFRIIREARRAETRLAGSEARFRRLAASNIVGVGFWHLDGRVIDANDALLAILGQDRTALTEQRLNWRVFTPPEHRSKSDQALAELATDGVCAPFQTEWLNAAGHRVPVLIGAAMLEGQSGLGVAYVQDLTELKRAEEELRLAALVLEQSSEAIMITDAASRIVRVNQAFTTITGYAPDEVLGHTPQLFKSGVHGEDFYREMWHQIATDGRWRGEIWDRRKSGQIYPKWLNITAIRDTQGMLTHYAAIFSDITTQKAEQARLERHAHYDALTGLPNRVLLAERLQHAMSEAIGSDQRLALIYLDLDGFKEINDQHGHAIGDRLLVAIAERMEQSQRANDTVARLGGDEFVCLLTGLDSSDASLPVVKRLLGVISRPVHIDGLVLQVSASLGVSFFPQANEIAPDQLMRQADQAMYTAKVSGKNRYHIFDAAQDQTIRGERVSQECLRHALHGGELVVHYQPKVNLRSGALLGAEALLRWDHPRLGLIPPGEFLPIVDEDPLALQIDDWVLDQALKQIEDWRRSGYRIPVSVNLGAWDLQRTDFTSHLRERLAEHPELEPHDLTLEIMEATALQDMDHVSRVIQECSELGVDFALDDFGTGYSSLTYLKRLPAAELKIDRSFVLRMLDDPDDLTIVDGVLGLAVSFGRQVVAEGVERDAHATMLLRLGCEVGQGYAIARAMPAGNLLDWAAGWHPPAAWSNQRRAPRHRLPYLFAAVEHRGWLGRLRDLVAGTSTSSPPLDGHQCRLGRLLDDNFFPVRADGPLLAPVAELHRQAHDLARRLLTLHANHSRSEAAKCLAELEELSSTLCAELESLCDLESNDDKDTR